MVSLDVGGHANLVEDLRHLHPQGGADRLRIEMLALHGEQGEHPVGHFVFVIGGQGEIGNASGGNFPLHHGVGVGGGHYVKGVLHIGVLGHRVDNANGVQPRHEEIHNDQLGALLPNLAEKQRAVPLEKQGPHPALG